MSKKYRQRGTYLHEWVCDCGHTNSQGREPKSLGRKVGTWCPGCRRMKLVPVPAELDGYIPRDADEIERLKSEIWRKRGELKNLDKLFVAQRAETERLKTENAALNNEVRLLHNDATTHSALLALVEQLAGALEAIERHHVALNKRVRRPEMHSHTISLARTALAAAAEYRKEKA